MNHFPRLLVFALGGMLAMTACEAQEKHQDTMQEESDHRKANHLVHETSPYLLQHAYNPVDWHPWNAEALEKARTENKLMIISIGYAACHWCHVMEHESFEDSVVAVKMNANYVSIKVDREERPDIDQIYMNAAYMITGRGGWPLNAIALPDGRPVYAGTYFPKDNWIKVLDHFTALYETDPQKLIKQAEQVTAGVRSMETPDFNPVVSEFTRADLDAIWRGWQDKIDYRYGGRSGAPKFMMPNNYDFLLRYYTISEDPKVLEAIQVTLEKMAFGGLYDQAGGGFARYSTDEYWKVPHFEKMLYDNGQLVSLYANAYQLTKNPMYERIVRETLEFVERELSDPSGGFYSSLDADSEGEEGKFYIWTAEELRALWGKDYAFLADYYSVTEQGNWESGQNILWRQQTDADIMKKHGLDALTLARKLSAGKAAVMKAREDRIRPGLDDKILTSWNALMLKGYIDAYNAFGDAAYLERALANADFLVRECLRKDGGLYRNYKNGRATINAFLDDYSLTAEAFIALYEATFDESWLQRAAGLARYCEDHFLNPATKMFYFTSDEDPALLTRSTELSDNVISSSNSSLAKALLYLGHYFYNDAYVGQARKMLSNIKDDVIKNGPFYANWATLMTHFVVPVYEVAIVGKDWNTVRSAFGKAYEPHVLLLGGADEGGLELLEGKKVKGETMIYVCRDKACKLPTSDIQQAMKMITY